MTRQTVRERRSERRVRRWLRVAMIVLGIIGPGACTYDVPEVVARDASAAHVDSSVRDAPGETGETSTAMDGGLLDTSVPDGAGPPDSAQGGETGASDGQASDGSVCTGVIAWKETTTFSMNGVTNIALPSPTSIAPNDLLLAYIVVYSNSNAGLQGGVNVPQGWTLNGSQQQDGYYEGASGMEVYRHVAGAAEPTSYVFTVSKPVEVIAWILDYTGVSPNNPVDAHSTVGQNVLALPYPTPGVTTSGLGELIIATFACSASPLASGWAVPAGMTERSSLNDQQVLMGASDDEPMFVPGNVGPFDSVPQGGPSQVNTVITHVITLRPCP